MSLSMNTDAYLQARLAQIQAKANQAAQNRAANPASNQQQDVALINGTGELTEEQAMFYDDIVSNECTDDKDDGKIGFWSKVGNVLQGVGKSILNIGKTIIKNPLKTLGMVAVCCIPVVGPIVGGALACYGIYKGGEAIYNAAQLANNATTDAEAKAAWENIGGGATTVAISAVGLKGSAAALKGQLTGGSATVNAVRNAKAAGSSVDDIVQVAIREGAKETAANMYGVYSAARTKCSSAFEKVRNLKNGTTTPKELGSSAVDSFAKWAGKKAQSTSNFFKRHFTKAGRADAAAAKAATKAPTQSRKSTVETLKETYGVKPQRTINGNYQVKLNDGTVHLYNKSGQMISKTTTTTNSYGQTVETVQTFKPGSTTPSQVTTKTIGANGKVVKTGTETTTNTGTYKTGTQINGTKRYFNSSTKTGYMVKANGETVYMLNGKIIQKPTALQKAQIRAEVSPTYQATSAKVNKIIDTPTTVCGVEISDPTLMGLGVLKGMEE